MRRVGSDTSISVSKQSGQQVNSGGRVRRLSSGYSSSRVFKDGLNNNVKHKDSLQSPLSALPVMFGDIATQQLPSQMVAMLEDVSKEQEVEATLHVSGMQAVHCLEQYGMKLEDLMAPPLDDRPSTNLHSTPTQQSKDVQNVSLCLMTPSTDGVENDEQFEQILRRLSSQRSFRNEDVSKTDIGLRERTDAGFRERNEALDEFENRVELLYDNRKQYHRRRRKFWRMTPSVEFPSYIDKIHTLSGVDLMLMEMNYCHGIHEECTLDKNTLTIDEDNSDCFCYLYDNVGVYCLLLPSAFSEQDDFVSNLQTI